MRRIVLLVGAALALAAAPATAAGTAAGADPGGAAPQPGSIAPQSSSAPARSRPSTAAGGAAPVASAPAQGVSAARPWLGARPLAAGSRGRYVLRLQRWLRKLGLRLPQTGRFGSATSRAVRAFQRAHGLPASGVVDPGTVAALAVARFGATPASVPPGAAWVFPIQPRSLAVDAASWTQDQGIDIATSGGACGPAATLVAVAPGTVVKEGVAGFGSYAPVIQLDSGPDAGRYVYYGHAAPALVPVGAHVVAGQPIAQIGCGQVGRSSGPHLEIGISRPGGPVCCPAVGETSAETLARLSSAK